MNAQTPQSTWQSIGDLVAALVQKETSRKGCNPSGSDTTNPLTER